MTEQVTIDALDREEVHRLIRVLPVEWGLVAKDGSTLSETIDQVQEALQAYANPAPPLPGEAYMFDAEAGTLTYDGRAWVPGADYDRAVSKTWQEAADLLAEIQGESQWADQTIQVFRDRAAVLDSFAGDAEATDADGSAEPAGEVEGSAVPEGMLQVMNEKAYQGLTLWLGDGYPIHVDDYMSGRDLSDLLQAPITRAVVIARLRAAADLLEEANDE